MTNKFVGGVLLGENNSPVTPPADHLLLHAQDLQGLTVLRLKDSAGTILKPMAETVIAVQNVTGSTLAAGALVEPTGIMAGTEVPTVALARADAASTMPAIGAALAAIPNNTVGRIMTSGKLLAMNTTGMTANDVLYVSTTTAGGITNARPTPPNKIQPIGTVLSVGNPGLVYVEIDNVAEPKTQYLPFFYGSALAATTGVGRFPILDAGVIDKISARVNAAPSAGAVTVGFRLNGAAAFSTLTIAQNAFTGTTTGISRTVADGDYITVDISGTLTGASDLVASARFLF